MPKCFSKITLIKGLLICVNIDCCEALECDRSNPIKCSTKPITIITYNKAENLMAYVDEGYVIGVLRGTMG